MTVMHPGARWSQEKAVEVVLPDWVLEPGDDIRVIASRNDDTYEFEIRVVVRRRVPIDIPAGGWYIDQVEGRVEGPEAAEVFNHLIGWDDPINEPSDPHTQLA